VVYFYLVACARETKKEHWSGQSLDEIAVITIHVCIRC
jgi:hypothetical protein